ncbi:MAG: helix-turn-helix domain-containing protein [Burkholderiales bacterium]|jgi:excisionase family DNA binding protein|nr:helix-turn-helix domain-containing protein [Burkholderiales bacterium]
MTATAYLTVKQAANVLSIHPITVRRMAADGRIPAFRLGRTWRFVEIDLLAHARANYNCASTVSDERGIICRSTNAKTLVIGGRRSQGQAAAEYAALLAPKTESKRRNGTTAHAQKYGALVG